MKKILFTAFALIIGIQLTFAQSTGTPVSNKPSGGTLTLGTSSLFNVNQTTAGQTITVPSPGSSIYQIQINNVGSTSVTVTPGGVVQPGYGCYLRWTGASWSVTGVGYTGGGGGAGTITGVTAGTWLTGGGTTGTVTLNIDTSLVPSQTDLATGLAAKINANSSITGSTKTKITYDSKGLITVGADATTADIAPSSNRNYLTDAQQTILGNTSGTNTGDQTNITGNSATVTTNANLTGPVTSVGNATTITATGVGAGSCTSCDLTVGADGRVTVKANGSGGGAAAAGTLTGTTLASNVVTSSLTSFGASPTLTTPILGTPTSATLTNAIGLPISTGVTGLATGIATWLATPSSANLASAITDETGSGVAVFGTAPTFTTSITSPIVYGSAASSGTLLLQSTSNATLGNSTYNAANHFFQFSGTQKLGMTANVFNATFSSFTLSPVATTTGVAPPFAFATSGQTARTVNTQVNEVSFDLSATVTWAGAGGSGAVAEQNAFLVKSPTYAMAGANTITTASTFTIDRAPAAGTNATITNKYALWVKAGTSQLDGGVTIGTAGSGISIKSGSNCTLNTATLSSGTVTVSNTKVTANSIIFLQTRTASGTLGTLSYTISAGTSFTITSTSALDNSTVGWWILEPN